MSVSIYNTIQLYNATEVYCRNQSSSVHQEYEIFDENIINNSSNHQGFINNKIVRIRRLNTEYAGTSIHQFIKWGSGQLRKEASSSSIDARILIFLY